MVHSPSAKRWAVVYSQWPLPPVVCLVGPLCAPGVLPPPPPGGGTLVCHWCRLVCYRNVPFAPKCTAV